MYIRLIFLFLFLFLAKGLLAQKLNAAKNHSFKTIAPRFGVGLHNGVNYEIGLSALYISNIGLQWGAATIYTTYFIHQNEFNSNSNVDGFKVGVQSSWAFLMWGLELKTGNYLGNAFTYLSPKIGLSWLDVVNLEYLINISENKEKFPFRSNHQIGINFSLNKKIYNSIWKK